MRKMATIRKIDSLRPIIGADAIECAIVGGWNVVTRKGEYTAGDLVVYCEIDSFIPTTIAPFLTKPGHYAKNFEGVEGERLRTVKLRGQLSQGLLLPLSVLTMVDSMLFEGLDVSFPLGIVKYEAPIPAALQGEVKGMFPSVIPKTDQERIQNLSAELEEWRELSWEVTEKLDGSSMTVYCIDGEVGVCSRNLDLKRNEDNSLWKAAIKYGLEEKLVALNRNIAIQGELIGNGIQKNIYKLHDQDFYVYDIYDIDVGVYLSPYDRRLITDQLGLKHCPVISRSVELNSVTVADLLIHAEGKSVLNANTEREGLVFKCHEDQLSFKAISNKFLMKHNE